MRDCTRLETKSAQLLASNYKLQTRKMYILRSRAGILASATDIPFPFQLIYTNIILFTRKYELINTFY